MLMKSPRCSIVLTADQRASRTHPDRVPEALDALAEVPTVRAFERTAGDEIQAVLPDGRAAVEAVTALSRLGEWRVGIGIGPVETPLPESTRAGRGPAFIAARVAVDQAKRTPTGLAVRAPEDSSTAAREDAESAEAALWMLGNLLARRSEHGWAVSDLLTSGVARKDAADELGVSPSAVTQRARAAAYDEVERGGRLAARLLDEASATAGGLSEVAATLDA